MKELLSKELLSLVLGEDIVTDKIYTVGNNLVWYHLNSKGEKAYKRDVNLDTLGRLCKEFCLKQGYTLRTEPIDDDGLVYWVIAVVEYTDDAEYLRFSSLDTDNELEAVLLGTEFVAKEKKLL